MPLQAVLTGDIVNSTKLSAAKMNQLTHRLTHLLQRDKFEFFRGDSFQAHLKMPQESLRMALLCRTAAISLLMQEKKALTDIRISIGVGKVNTPVRKLMTAKGEAFILSGRKFDEISKSSVRLAITSGNALANEGLQVISDYLNAIFEKMTAKQAEVIFQLLKGEIQQTIAKKLKKTKSTIHQRVIAGRWPEIEKLLTHYEKIINQLV
jgi:DNA-binding NarL/FixJ family response regulator